LKSAKQNQPGRFVVKKLFGAIVAGVAASLAGCAPVG
jgi:hypothetical protein